MVYSRMYEWMRVRSITAKYSDGVWQKPVLVFLLTLCSQYGESECLDGSVRLKWLGTEAKTAQIATIATMMKIHVALNGIIVEGQSQRYSVSGE